jgi:hypothetical protein
MAFILFSLLIITACINRDERIVRYVDDDAVFFDYQVWGDDEKPVMTVMLRFRADNAEGSAAAMQQPVKVELDSQALMADSTKLSGVFYEQVCATDSFEGKHSIVVTGISGRKYTEKFEFHPFRIAATWPDTLHRKDLALQFNGLEKEDYIRIIALDTVFRSGGINELDTVKNGKISLTGEQLKGLVNGRVRIEFYKEVEKPVKNGTSDGGRLLITYGVKRDFILVD